MKKSISTLLATAITLAISFSASNSQAQSYYPQGSYHSSGCSNTLGQYVFSLDQYGDQMTCIYAMEARNYCGCTNSAALLAEMRRYNCHTNTLVSAYRGSCPATFRNAACNVRNSLTRIEGLHRRARVSRQVCALISQSCPLATYVHRNYSLFRPVVHAPIHHHTTTFHGNHRGTSQCGTGHRRGGIDVGSAIFGAVAGRVIHGIIHNH